jgi:hypothetical protein
VVLLPLIPLLNPQVKGLDFGVFRVLGLEVFLRVDFDYSSLSGYWGPSF